MYYKYREQKRFQRIKSFLILQLSFFSARLLHQSHLVMTQGTSGKM